MNAKGVTASLIVCLAAGGAGGYWFAKHRGAVQASDHPTTAPSEDGAHPDDEKPVVAVQTVPLKRETITQPIIAYGSVIAEPGEVRVLSMPFESRIAKLRIIPGESVSAGQEMADIEPSPDAQIALQEARNAVEATGRDLAQTEQRFKEHLATNVDLSQAQQAAQVAKLKLQSLTERGVGQPQKLTAPAAGIISKVDVQEGQIVPAGGAIVEVAASNRIEVRLSVDPSDVLVLKPAEPISLRLTNNISAEPIQGKVRTISRRVDPATRLVEVRVSLPQDQALLLDSFVVGEFVREEKDAFVIPRDAAIPTEGGQATLFTVDNGHAVKHVVKLGLQNDHDVQVIGGDLQKEMAVVSSGNYLLENGMEVEVSEAPTTAPMPASAPSTAPAEDKS